MKKQRGLSLFGLLVIGALVGFFVLLGIKCVPAYTEYFGVKNAITALIKDSASAPAQEIRAAFDKRGLIEGYKIRGDELDIDQTPNGTTIGIEYDREVPVAANISLKIHFTVSQSTAGKSAEQGQ
ncbi:DUF4845 domain-containing protein [Chitinivorax sp. PXF-14]|uniref:DUF4845 domain-containing protein n=1 Tax=Chitinivorax sp. PXF-14 TaxID=3230488 RepID=UPI003466E89A